MSETAQRSKRRGLDSSTRGAIVLAVVVVLGLVLLAKAAPSSSTSIENPDRPASTTPPTRARPATTRPVTTASTAPAVAHPAAQVKVLLLNATGGKVPKASGMNGAKVKARGYDTLPPANASVARPLTAVYFTAGYQADAVAVAKVLGHPATVAVPLPTPSPAPNASGANVVVLLGQDTPAA